MRQSPNKIVTWFAVVFTGATLAVVCSPAGPAAAAGPGVAIGQLPLPSDGTGSGQPSVSGIACGAPGFCVAVGGYPSTSGGRGLIETWSGGAWSATPAPVPTGVNAVSSYVKGVACSGTATCAAYGSYYVSDGVGGFTSAWMLLGLKAGVWTASTLSPPSGAFPAPSSGFDQAIEGIGCAGPDACAIAGNFYPPSSTINAWYATYAGTWQQTHVAPLSNDAANDANHFADLNGLACGGGLCQAVGAYGTDVGPEPLVVSITPSSDSANAPSSHPPLPAGATEINGLTGIACASGGACVAHGTYYTSGGSNAQSFVDPVGGTAFQPQQPPTPTPASSTAFPNSNLWAVACANNGCLVGGSYYDAASTFHPLADRFVFGANAAWVADQPSIYPVAAACGDITFCVAYSSTFSDPIDVLIGTTWQTATLSNSEGVSGAACDSSTSCWVIGTSSSGTLLYADHITPTAPSTIAPKVTLSTPTAPFTTSAAAKLTWHGTAGSAPIAHYTVQLRRAAWNGKFGTWSTPASWASLHASTTSVLATLPVGYDSCFRVEAVDTLGHGAWSSTRCTARPLDDKSLAASSTWTRHSNSAYYLGTYTTSTHLHATLTRSGAEFDRLALVATRCPSCGVVGIYSGTTKLASVNLFHSTTVRKAVFVLVTVGLRTTTVTIKTFSSGKTVQIDGLGISRT